MDVWTTLRLGSAYGAPTHVFYYYPRLLVRSCTNDCHCLSIFLTSAEKSCVIGGANLRLISQGILPLWFYILLTTHYILCFSFHARSLASFISSPNFQVSWEMHRLPLPSAVVAKYAFNWTSWHIAVLLFPPFRVQSDRYLLHLMRVSLLPLLNLICISTSRLP